MLLKDIIGQQAVKRELCHSVQEGKIPHALLMSGSAGVGKLPLALAFAQYVACKHRTDTDACGVCPTCLQYSKLQHPDLHFAFPIVKVDKGAEVCDDYLNDFREMVRSNPYCDPDDWTMAMGAEKKQSLIYEKESSEIQRKLSLKSFADGYKVMIIWQPQKMNITCANKLLKILEEPPQKTVFLLVTEQPDQLLSTILSRVQQVRLSGLTEQEIASGLQAKGYGVQHALDWAHIAGGSYLAALKLADESSANKRYLDDFIALMRDAYTIGHIKNAAKKAESLSRIRRWSLDIADAKVGRERQKAFLQYAQRQVRENFIYNLQHPELNYQTTDERTFSENFAPYINEGNVEQIMSELDKAERQIGQNGNAKIIFFDLCLQFIVLLKK